MTDEEARLVELMVAYQAGELEAFERLYLTLSPDVRGYFALVVRDRAATADLVQETFLEVHRSRRTYAPPLPVRPWVFGIARHVQWRHRRLALRRARHEDPHAEPVDPPALDETPRAIDRRDVEDALREVPESRRAVWLLHHVHGFSFQEIADRLRIGVGAARLRSSRAMNTLRAKLGAGRGDPARGGPARGGPARRERHD
jgi:RNA polymerase sigma-70 factor (ECF subfamily)